MKVKERSFLPISEKKPIIRVGLVYPNNYKAGMSSYAVHLLYDLFNRFDEVRCERYFLPEKIKMPLERQTGFLGHATKLMKSIEYGTPLSEMDIIAITLQFEPDYVNIFWILESIGIPLLVEERITSGSENGIKSPLIIGGGPSARSNPLTMLPFMDMMVFNDFEPIYEDVVRFFIDNPEKTRGFSVRFQKSPESFRKLINMPNLLISRLTLDYLRGRTIAQLEKYYDIFPKENAPFENLTNDLAALHQVIPEFEASDDELVFGETYLIELNRGCPYNCKFCLTGCLTKPFRNRNYQDVIEIIDHYVELSQVKKVTFIGSAIADHPNFSNILQYLTSKSLRIMIPSVRIEKLDLSMLKSLRAGGLESITVAPETGSDRLRATINKRIKNQKIIKTVELMAEAGFKSTKMYFLIGLPGETDADLRAIGSLAGDIMQRIPVRKSNFKVHFSINFMIPKIGTPFENYTGEFKDPRMRELKRKSKIVSEALKQVHNLTFKIMDIKEARMQAFFSLADETAAEELIEVYHMGARPNSLKKIEQRGEFLKKTLWQDSRDKISKIINFGRIFRRTG